MDEPPWPSGRRSRSRDVPEHHLALFAGGGRQRLPIRAERDPVDEALAALEGGELAVVVGGVPEHHLAGVAGGGERLPIRAERDPGDGALAALDGELAVVVGGVQSTTSSVAVAAATVFPSGLNATPLTELWPLSRAASLP